MNACFLQQLSLTARLSLFFTSLACVVLLALGWLIGASIETHFEEQDRHALSGKLELAQHIIERVDNAEDVKRLQEQLGDALVGHHDLLIHIRDKQGNIILSSDEKRFPELLLSEAPNQTVSHTMAMHTWQSEGQSYRGLITRLATKNPQFSPITVAIATDIAHHQAFMKTFMKTLWLFVIVAALLTGVLAWFAASRGLGPLKNMSARASEITANKLNQRLSLDSVPPELADLAHHLNQMLARLEEAFHRLSDFSSDLAHELRTPISNLMMQTQVSLTQTRDAASYREVLESNAEEYARLASMISDMLFLAKAEHGAQLVHQERVDLRTEIHSLFEYYEALAEERNITFELHCDEQHTWEIMGDRLMLRRAFSNILSNALRYATAHTKIEVELRATDDQLQIYFNNRGQTIPATQLSRLFERFYRADHARQHADGEGAGLGLAIVQAIVRGHAGQITARSESGLTSFIIKLPATSK
ncbi:heavy metal sensor histidine kinase [Undibacterium sp. LX40W]|uniref:Sensor protein n=1 Tax=Undibacterium nitidum TaxID=2762298 RepID=A0A923KT07_9BURK|nr:MULTISPECIES: heavy metal sensor histidine kinase [Undibacterium]MBC3880802.1 heavy metal sensor histidine kinase [Undibacterium nitidum]MBC3890465.1 heavy metal sensor histidine kinase [Undibacterium sp. LX40W]